MSVSRIFRNRASKEIDSDAASDSTASGNEPPSSPDRFFPPGLAAVDSGNSSLQGSLSAEASTPSESDVDATAVDLSPVGSVGRFAGQPLQVPPPPPGLHPISAHAHVARPPPGFGGVDIYSSPPPGLHPISAHTHVARPAPGLERATESVPSTRMPAPPPQLAPTSVFPATVVPEVPAWVAAGASELASEPYVLQPVPWDANMSRMGSVTNGQPLNPECEAFCPFVNPVPGWSTCVASDKLNPDDVSLKVAEFAKHHVRENSPDRKRNLQVSGGLQSHNIEGCWQQVPQMPQVDHFNGLEQDDWCQLAGCHGTPMWNGCEDWRQDRNSSHDPNLSQPPNWNGTSCLPQQLNSAYNSDMYQELNFHHGLGCHQELYLADHVDHHRHHVDHQEFTEFMGDLSQNCGQSLPWNMQSSSRQDSSWAPAFFGPGSNELY